MCDSLLRDTLNLNKREMFDGMRAYHQSEIQHTNHAVTVLISVIGAANAGMLAIITNSGSIHHPKTAAIILLVSILLVVTFIARITHNKINGDHAVYKNFGAEYSRTCELLALFEENTIGGKSIVIKINRNIGQGDGYKKVQRIVWTFAILGYLLTTGLTIIVYVVK